MGAIELTEKSEIAASLRDRPRESWERRATATEEIELTIASKRSFQKIWRIVVLLILAGPVFAQAPSRVQLGNPSASFMPAWRSLRLGAGGNLGGIHTYADGTILTHADTYGGYVYVAKGGCTVDGTTYPPECWQQLVTTDSMPSGDATLARATSGNVGVAEVVAAPSDTNVLYMIWNNAVYVSTNRGATWVGDNKTLQLAANGGPLQSAWMAVDPVNPDLVYLATPSSGTFYTTTGRSGNSATWMQVSAIANANGNGGSIIFDPNSAVVSGRTQRILISASGVGVYETTDGGPPAGGSFALISSGSPPTKVIQLACDKFSQIWATESFKGTGGQLFKYASGTWTKIKISGEPQPIVSLVFDPDTGTVASNHVIAVDGAGGLVASLDNGSTWISASPNPPGNNFFKSSSAPQPVWLDATFQGTPLNMNVNMAAIDPSGNIWAATGIDVFKTPNPIVSGVVKKSTTWSADTIGIDQLVTNLIVVPPGNSPIVSVWDRGNFLVRNPDVFPAAQFPNSAGYNIIMGAWGTDYAAAGGTPNFIVSTISSQLATTPIIASSSDGGNSWKLIPNLPEATPSPAGVIAASTASNWITLPGDSNKGNTVIYYTTNAGATWAKSTLTGSPTFVVSNIGRQDNRQPLAADKVIQNRFYAVDRSQNFYVSTDGGANFAAAGATSAKVDGYAGRDMLLSVPGNANHLIYAPHLAPRSHLWKSTDGGATWAKIPSGGAVDRVGAVGFGAPRPGNSYPTIYAYANYRHAAGVYQSNDGGTTWGYIKVPIGERTWPYKTLDQVTWIAGDPNVYGRIYLGFLGSGATYIDTADACPWVNFSNINPNSVIAGTVTLTAQHSGLVPVSSVQFSVDGTNIGSVLTGAGPYSQTWNTTGITSGSHTLKVQATGNGCSGSFSIPVTTGH
jgi:Bacterial Ig domain